MTKTIYKDPYGREIRYKKYQKFLDSYNFGKHYYKNKKGQFVSQDEYYKLNPEDRVIIKQVISSKEVYDQLPSGYAFFRHSDVKGKLRYKRLGHSSFKDIKKVKHASSGKPVRSRLRFDIKYFDSKKYPPLAYAEAKRGFHSFHTMIRNSFLSALRNDFFQDPPIIEKASFKWLVYEEHRRRKPSGKYSIVGKTLNSKTLYWNTNRTEIKFLTTI